MFSKQAIKILLIDNEETNFITLKSRFENEPVFKHTLDYAPTFADGQNKACSKNYDILIIRFRLRADKKNGLNFVYALRNNGCKTPAILLTDDDGEKLCLDECSKRSISRCVSQSEQSTTLLISIIADTVLHFEKNAE